MIFKIVILVALIKLVMATQNFLLAAGIYSSLVVVFALLFGVGLIPALIAGSIVAPISALYFWLLVKLEGAEFAWWAVCIIGMVVVFL